MIITLKGEEVTEALKQKRDDLASKIRGITLTGNDKAQAELPALATNLVRINEMLQSVVSHRTYEIVEYVTAQPPSDAAEVLGNLTDTARQAIADELRPGGRLHNARNQDKP